MSSIIMTYKLKGILYAILALIPHHLLFVLLLIVYSSIMLNYSFKLYNTIKLGEAFNIKLYTKRILILFITALIICMICTLLELYINRLLLNIFL